MGDGRLVPPRVACVAVDVAEDAVGVEIVHEGARTVVDGFAGDGAVVGIHHAVDESEWEPFRDELCLGFDDVFEKGESRALLAECFGVVAVDTEVGEQFQSIGILSGCEILERSDPDVAGGDTGENSSGCRLFSSYGFSSRCRCQGAGGRDAECVHRLADDVFPQHGTER